MKMKFRYDKSTKNTMRFVEIEPDEEYNAIYIQKDTLNDIGYKIGEILIVNIDTEE